MKVVLLAPRATADGAQNAGDEVTVTADEAARMIEVGTAAPVRGSKPETAAKKRASEKAAK